MRGAIILAGGKGSRIGGEKHLRVLGGKALMLHVVEKASSVADEVIVVLKNDDPQTYRKLLPDTVKIVRDSTQSEAPIVGIKTGGNASASEYSAFLSCDLAFLNPAVLEFLFSQAEGIDGVIPEWPDGLLEPLHAVYRTKLAAEAAEAALNAHEYRTISVAKRLETVKHVAVDELRKLDPDLLSFFNVNTAEDLAKAEKLLAHQAR